MKAADFVLKNTKQLKDKGVVHAQAPSNIALVKYWGKKDEQIPCNPSISFTLSNAVTKTALHFEKTKNPTSEFDIEVYFNHERKKSFEPKIINFFYRINQYVSFLNNYQFKIYTENTFPHSSGIASSASAMASIAVCLMEMEKAAMDNMPLEFYNKKASFLARLGSGSACRSITNSLVLWGKLSGYRDGSNLYGVPVSPVHPVFQNYQDSILLVDKGQKPISSSKGHELMHHHPYANQRFYEASENAIDLLHALIDGDLDSFIKLVEKEALSLHAMMMTSKPYFILMKPDTLQIIQHIWAFREKTGLPACFTLDAGANVHLLYPKKHLSQVREFIQSELIQYCQDGQVIHDEVGQGAKVLS